MKLKNKKTGEIVELFGISCKGLRTFLQFKDNRGNFKFECNSFAELNNEWEDYEEESKEYWYIEEDGDVIDTVYLEDDKFDQKRRQIGNYFETREEAEKAVEKLKAWKRLKDKGFINEQVFSMNLNWCNPDDDDWKAFKLLFGGEE